MEWMIGMANFHLTRFMGANEVAGRLAGIGMVDTSTMEWLPSDFAGQGMEMQNLIIKMYTWAE